MKIALRAIAFNVVHSLVAHLSEIDETWYTTLHMKMTSYLRAQSHANLTHFHRKGYAPGLVLKEVKGNELENGVTLFV